MSVSIASFLERNKKVVATHQPIPTFAEMFAAGSLTLRVAIITCADPRCHPEHYFDLAVGEAAVFRDAGGRVTPNVLKDIVSIDAVTGGCLEEIAIVHHTDCGAFQFNDEKLRALVQERGVSAEDAADLKFGGFSNLEQGVKDDLAILRGAKMVREALRSAVRGFTYDLSTGQITPVQE